MNEDCVPRFTRGHRLRHDTVRDLWMVQAPEKAFVADPIAAQILQCVDGVRSLGRIIDDLAARFEAPRETIAVDVRAMLESLAEKKVIAW